VFLAVARHANSTKSNKLREFIQIPVNLWEACADEGTTALWQTNDVSITDWSTGGYGAVNTVYRFHGVRIEPNDAMPKVLPNADSPPTRDKNTGGRPPKPFWDDMWAAICASIYHNELMPTKQVEIESAMSDWIVANGHEAGTTQIRDKARKLFNLIK
jgi:hypothetical protein